MTAGAQIKRFLILHKELDADDGEVTRTQKVRRGFVAERYAPLINALYDGSSEADISTEVTFEDGRKGVISARVKISDVATVPVAPAHGEGGMTFVSRRCLAHPPPRSGGEGRLAERRVRSGGLCR